MRAQLDRVLAAAEPAAHTPEVARSLSNLGNRLEAVGEHRQALALQSEAVARWSRLAQLDRDAFNDSYLQARARLARRFTGPRAWRRTGPA